MIEFKKIFNSKSFLGKFLLLLTNSVCSISKKLKKGDSFKYKFMILSFHRIGDSIFTLPALKAFFDKYDINNSVLICFEKNEFIYNYALPQLKVVSISNQEIFANGRLIKFSTVKKLIKNFNSENIIDITGTIISAEVIFFSKAKFCVGFADEFSKKLYDFSLRPDSNKHLTNIYKDAFSYFQISNSEEFNIFPIKLRKSRTIFINLFAGWKAKDWGTKNFIELASLLNKEFKISFFYEYGKLPEDIKVELLKKGFNVFETHSIKEIFNVIKDAFLVIGNDTGPLYIANLMGIPTYAVYGPTGAKFILPYGNYHRYSMKILHCSPLNSKHCYTDAGINCPTIDCMKQLSIQEVYDGVKNLISDILSHPN